MFAIDSKLPQSDNLGGNTLSNSSGIPVIVSAAGNITIKNGSIDAHREGVYVSSYIYGDAFVTLENVNVTSDILQAVSVSDETLTINGGTYTVKSNNSSEVLLVNGGKVTVKDGACQTVDSAYGPIGDLELHSLWVKSDDESDDEDDDESGDKDDKTPTEDPEEEDTDADKKDGDEDADKKDADADANADVDKKDEKGTEKKDGEKAEGDKKALPQTGDSAVAAALRLAAGFVALVLTAIVKKRTAWQATEYNNLKPGGGDHQCDGRRPSTARSRLYGCSIQNSR